MKGLLSILCLLLVIYKDTIPIYFLNSLTIYIKIYISKNIIHKETIYKP